MFRSVLAFSYGVLAAAVAAIAAADPVPSPASLAVPTVPAVPAWLFPLLPAAASTAALFDSRKPLHLPRSQRSYTEAQLNDLFMAPDWHPDTHAAMPDIVARGRAPEVFACGYCHTAGGQGRPENASLAGLPAPYIVQQLDDFRSGARRSAWPEPYRPAERMIQAARHVTSAEAAAAARYFSEQKLQTHVRVVETTSVPRSRVVGWVYAVLHGGGDEALGRRLLEFTPDPARHEYRDDELTYIAYVPPGSIARGQAIASNGGGGISLPCMACHGPTLQGVGLVPRLAGRSPTYLLRALVAFKTNARSGVSGAPMKPVVAGMDIGSMIDAAAYAASLPP